MAKKNSAKRGAYTLPTVSVNPRESDLCVNCGKKMPKERIDALKSLGTPMTLWAHTQCSTITKIKGIYLGEVGTSQLQLCDKIYNDSVRSVFRRTEFESDEDSTEPDDT